MLAGAGTSDENDPLRSSVLVLSLRRWGSEPVAALRDTLPSWARKALNRVDQGKAQLGEDTSRGRVVIRMRRSQTREANIIERETCHGMRGLERISVTVVPQAVV
jgi:hypothetical protein